MILILYVIWFLRCGINNLKMSFTRTVLNTPKNMMKLKKLLKHLRQFISIDAFQ